MDPPDDSYIGDRRMAPHPSRRYGGRRHSDYDERITINRKLLVVLVIVVDVVYQIGEPLLLGHTSCF